MAFPKYESYKDSGVEWLGEIPEHWRIVKLKTISSVINGSTPDSSIPKYWDGSIVWITPSDLGKLNGIYISDSERKITIQGLNSCGTKICPKKSIILSTRAPIGNAAITKIPSSINQGCKTIVPDLKTVDSAFIYYLFYITKDYLNACGKGTTFKELSSNDLKSYQVVIPLLEEQNRIADFLDRTTTDIDQAIAKKQRLIELLNEQKSILINRAVTKGLNPNVPMRDSGIEWIGEIPEHWEVKRLKFISSIKYGLGQPPREKENGLPLIRATNVERGEIVTKDLIRVDPNDIPYERDPVLKAGDIIVVRSGAYTADSAIVTQEYEGSIAGYDMVVRASKQIIAKYLGFCLLAKYVLFDQLYLLRLRAAQPHLNAEELGDTLILIPPFKEQQEIILHLEVLGEEQKNITAITRKEIKLLNELKQLTIANAVTGKIKV